MLKGAYAPLAATLFTLASATGARAVDGAAPPPDPHAVAVNIELTPVQSWPGYGIYLGSGLVITAAHVVGNPQVTRPKVVFAGQRLATAPVKEGSYPQDDLTVLRITDPLPPALGPLHTAVCSDAPQPGEAVVVSTPEKLAPSAITEPGTMPANVPASYAAASIKDVYSTGNSGSGVFDAGRRCLLGIMSSKVEEKIPMTVNGKPFVGTVGIAKHFVPAADIRAFLAGLPPF